jgi:Ca2+-binding RTX toxin-like protein
MTIRTAKRRHLGLAAGAMAALTVGLMTASPASAASTSATVTDGLLTITGTNAGESLALRLAAGDANTLQVDFGDDGTADHSIDRSTFDSIKVQLRAGDDRFRIDQINGTIADEALTVFSAGGNDTIDGGDGVETFDGGSGNDAIDGNRGNDTGILGSGTDSFRWDPGDGSDVVEGRSGTDTLDFNGAGVAEKMSLSPNGGRSLFVRDVAGIRMDMNDVERLDLTALGGIDTVTVDDMRGTGFQQATVDLSGPAGGGDAAADVVTVNASDRAEELNVSARRSTVKVQGLPTVVDITGSELTDLLEVNALGGNDVVKVRQAARNLIGVAVDLGAGQR